MDRGTRDTLGGMTRAAHQVPPGWEVSVGTLLERRTKYVGSIALPALAAAVAFTRPQVASSSTTLLVGSYSLVAFPLLAAAACWWCAFEMASPSMRTQWVLLGTAAFAFATGLTAEEFLGVPVEGFTIAEVLYLTAIVLFGGGVWLAFRSFEGLLDLDRPKVVSIVAATIASAIGVAGLAGLFGRIDGLLIDKVLLGAYPILLLWLMAMPALALALTVSQMGGGSLARPWWAVFSGVMLLTVSNVMLIVTTALQTPVTNAGATEIGWWIGLSLIATGAAMQIDVQKPARRLARSA